MTLDDYKLTGQEIHLADYPCHVLSKEDDEKLKDSLYEDLVPDLVDWHNRLTAEGTRGVLIVLQALDAAGKDEIIRYIFSTLQPQALKVTSFQKPSDNEKAHDYLWRMHEGLPARGEIAILNRSYYEDIIAPQIHQSLDSEEQPEEIKADPELIEKRYEQIKGFEDYLTANGFPVLKLFFNMSKDTQRDRLLERIENPKKNYEFSLSDIEDRKQWDHYQEVFEGMLNHTATATAPWYVLPADNPWLSRQIATQALIEILAQLDPQYPEFSEEERAEIKKVAEQLRRGEI
ncbi:PPK2 family polyphosphate kinase [Aerococcus sanguinicola]|uniref:PPK2 family polyphosphate kinase n=1 Tax=Aerococcus sanguinicola TaxID=119206 RepID=UPI0018A78C45|nr:PPK2 family polyphosphate kinase [Aerococcus sanguinicola]